MQIHVGYTFDVMPSVHLVAWLRFLQRKKINMTLEGHVLNSQLDRPELALKYRSHNAALKHGP